MSPKRGAYPPEVRQAAIESLRAGRKPEELARELGMTVTTLRVWQYIAEGGVHGLDRTREGVIAQTVGAYERLDQLLRSVPLSALDTPMLFRSETPDPWRVKDAVAHVAHYKARVVHRLAGQERAKSRPGGVEPQMSEYWAPESWTDLAESDEELRKMDVRTRRRHGGNHLVYMRWRDETPKAVMAWHRLVHSYVLTHLKKGPDAWFAPPDAPASRSKLSNEAVATFSIHSDQHMRDIKRTLGQTS